MSTFSAPNILFIYLDDLGYGDAGCFNADSRIPTPNIDRIAREGVSFTDSHTPAAICGPSRYGLMTGRYPWRRGPGGTGNGAKYQDVFIEKGRETVASLLGRAGYNTGQFGKWGIRHNYSQAVKPGMDPGYAESYDFPDRRLLGAQAVGFDYAWHMTHLFPLEPSHCKHQLENGLPVDPDWATQLSDPYRWLPDSAMKIVEYLETYSGERENPNFNQDRDKPFFLYWDPPSPHEPIVPNQEFIGTSGAGKYGDFVVEIDHYIGRMLDALDRLGLSDNTLVVFSSDNGPETSCYQRTRECGHYSMGKLRGVKRDIWEGGHRLPLLVRWPGVTEPGRVSDQLVCMTDWLATFADMTGQQLPANAGEDSVSILPLLRGDDTPARDSVIHHMPQGHFAIRHNDWLYIDYPTGDANNCEPEWFRAERGVVRHEARGELFNLADDLQQTRNLYNDHPEIVKALKARLDKATR